MERSSPLAAMQPPSVPFGHCGFRSDGPTSFPAFASSRTFGPNSFNFKDLSMKRSQSDYFAMKPVRGSSPTASLAADLSQNFHIDQSPQLPTPRRSLFATSFLGALGGRDSVTTPPLPSSSPGPASDSMEISPLPHKIPYVAAVEIELQSPTPDLTPADNSSLSLPSPTSDSPEILRFQPPQERKRPNPIRPSLTKTKGLSTTVLPCRPSAETQLPPFKFGNGSSKLTSSSSMTLSEAFADSPPQDRAMVRNNPLMPVAAPRARQPFAGMMGGCRNSGSPVSGHVRKNSNPFSRPRKQFRRSLSMYENPQDMMKEEKSPFEGAGLPSIMDVEAGHVLQLPHFTPDDQAGSLPRIEKKTMIDVLDGKYQNQYDKIVVIDCRFEYEYKGGHIDGAVNFNDKDLLATRLFGNDKASKVLLVFHCEYSAHRAPIMAKYIRHRDRAVNADQYPHLTYPELYILDGGYSSFFAEYRSRCFPQNYVEMASKEHEQACERGLGRVKHRSKLVRAQTFAFGQQSPQVDDSPTAPSRNRHDINMDLDIGLCQTLEPGRRHAQRMASY